MENQITFPESFKSESHEVVPGATQWIYTKPNQSKISIVGGGYGLCGDGINTFEMWDFDEDEPRGYQTKEEINEYLKSI
mgnify:CR=1 FL=1|tara:strand:+ start:408 stop:644 length:237 start_codon:yes stop_codon:yes gene_type:complete